MVIGSPQSGLIVEVPAVEPYVGEIRRDLDPRAPLGVPAHVTVLFPFVAPDQLDDAVLRRVQDFAAARHAFAFRLTRPAWFGREVLWLAPEDDRPFRALTGDLGRLFPDHPPYGGQFDDPVPHLTVADGGPYELMLAAEQQLRGVLPIEARAEALRLMRQRRDGSWERGPTFPFAGAG